MPSGMVAQDPQPLQQHRDAGLRIVAFAEERQRPEMRRCPHEDDEEELCFKLDVT